MLRVTALPCANLRQMVNYLANNFTLIWLFVTMTWGQLRHHSRIFNVHQLFVWSDYQKGDRFTDLSLRVPYFRIQQILRVPRSNRSSPERNRRMTQDSPNRSCGSCHDWLRPAQPPGSRPEARGRTSWAWKQNRVLNSCPSCTAPLQFLVEGHFFDFPESRLLLTSLI